MTIGVYVILYYPSIKILTDKCVNVLRFFLCKPRKTIKHVLLIKKQQMLSENEIKRRDHDEVIDLLYLHRSMLLPATASDV